MKQTTLCYLEQDEQYLMLHRISKKNDENKDKWIGVGGKFEVGESPEQCLLREVKEETGLSLKSFEFRGILTFVSDLYEPEMIFLYTSNDFEGTLKQCEEGVLTWVSKDEIETLNLWEGDKRMFQLLQTEKNFFSLKLEYKGNDLQGTTEWTYEQQTHSVL